MGIKMLSVKLKESKNSLVNLPVGLEIKRKKKTIIERIKLKWQSGYQKEK
mgnify:FL=1|jgi:hypothetical protein